MIQPSSSTASQFGTLSSPSHSRRRGPKPTGSPWRLPSGFHLALLVVVGSLLSGGCSICETGYIEDYATVGGKWQRSHPAEGRVGSPFSDPGFVSTASANGGVHLDATGVPYHDGNDQAYDGIIIENGMEVDGFDGSSLPDSVIELDEDW